MSQIKQVKREMEAYKRSKSDPRAFVILDDCLYDASWTKDKMMRLLFMNGRHWKIMLVITMQYPLGIPPNLRTNIDYVFILREPYIANRKRIWENYAGMFPTFESFCQVMDQCTENYECLVLNLINCRTKYFGIKQTHMVNLNWDLKIFGKYPKILTPMMKKKPMILILLEKEVMDQKYLLEKANGNYIAISRVEDISP